MEAMGAIDISMINDCKKVRQLAMQDRIIFDELEYRTGLNKQLLDYIEYCGMDILVFIKDYCSNLQPFMIEKITEKQGERNLICVIDDLYRVSVNIKRCEKIEISFRENSLSIVEENNTPAKVLPECVPIFADCILGKVENENKYSVRVLVQRGLAIVPVLVRAAGIKDFFVVEKKLIDKELLLLCNDYIMDLYMSNLEMDLDKTEIFSELQLISFTAQGRSTFSNTSLLIDNLMKEKDNVGGAIADLVLVTYVQSLWLTKEQRLTLLNLLEQR